MGFIRRSADTASKNHRLNNNKYYDLIILIYLVYGENTIIIRHVLLSPTWNPKAVAISDSTKIALVLTVSSNLS